MWCSVVYFSVVECSGVYLCSSVVVAVVLWSVV